MAIIIKTDNPTKLLEGIKKKIDSKDVETWSYDTDGDFTHCPVQWKNKAWFRPKVSEDNIKFGLLGPKDTQITKLIYGLFHGRFIEMLLTHFDNDFSEAKATSQKTYPDNFD